MNTFWVRFFALSLFVSVTAPSVGWADTIDLSTFTPMTLARFEQLPGVLQDDPKGAKRMSYDMAAPAYSFAGSYTGHVRAIPAKRREYLKNYAKASQMEHFFAIYQEEVSLKEGGEEIWIPIQRQLVPAFKAEVKVGAPVRIYTRYLGTQELDRIFILVEFQAESLVQGIARAK